MYKFANDKFLAGGAGKNYKLAALGVGDIQGWDEEWEEPWSGQLQEGCGWGAQPSEQLAMQEGPWTNATWWRNPTTPQVTPREDRCLGLGQGSWVLVPSSTFSGRCGEGTRWNLGRQSGEQKLSLWTGAHGFIGNFTVQAAELYTRGKRNGHQIKELTGIWKLHSYCSQNSKWHTTNPSQWLWLYMRMGMAQRWPITVLTRYTCCGPDTLWLFTLWNLISLLDCMLIALEQHVNKYLLIFGEQKLPL